MRRVFALPLIVVALVVPAGLATAALNDVTGPACADIIAPLGSGTEVSYASNGTVAATIFVARASCRSITYTVYAIDEESGTVTSASKTGDGNAQFEDGTDVVELATIEITGDTNNRVCAYVTTTNNGGRLLDRAPDAGCVSLTKGGGAAGGGMN